MGRALLRLPKWDLEFARDMRRGVPRRTCGAMPFAVFRSDPNEASLARVENRVRKSTRESH
jgi:hypothetical protein